MASWSDRFTQMTQSAISKSKEVAGVTKLNMEISSLNQEIKNIQTQVGAYVLDNEFLMENPYVADWVEKMKDLKAEIEAKNEKIMELKNVVVCTGCGREVSRSNRFCEHCGTEIIIKAPAADAAEAPTAENVAGSAAESAVSAESEATDAAGSDDVIAEATDNASVAVETAATGGVDVTVEAAASDGTDAAAETAASDSTDATV